jgi:hypothetical protein
MNSMEAWLGRLEDSNEAPTFQYTVRMMNATTSFSAPVGPTCMFLDSATDCVCLCLAVMKGHIGVHSNRRLDTSGGWVAGWGGGGVWGAGGVGVRVGQERSGWAPKGQRSKPLSASPSDLPPVTRGKT